MCPLGPQENEQAMLNDAQPLQLAIPSALARIVASKHTYLPVQPEKGLDFMSNVLAPLGVAENQTSIRLHQGGDGQEIL